MIPRTALFALLFTACSGESPTPAPERTEDTLVLLEAGSEPRRTLRYAIPDGIERTQVTYEIDMRIESGPDASIEASMRIEVTLRASSRAVGSDGVVDQRIHIEEAALVERSGEDGIARQFSAIERLRGITFSARLEPDGVYADRVVPEIADTSPQAQVALDMLLETVFGATPLPREPIGVGARWEVLRSTDFVGPSTPMQQRATYELVSFDGERVGIRVRTRQVGDREPGAQRGTHLASEGSGELTLDLHRTFADGVSTDEGVGDVAAEGPRPAAQIHQRMRMRYHGR